jgi:hypothetical protein
MTSPRCAIAVPGGRVLSNTVTAITVAANAAPAAGRMMSGDDSRALIQAAAAVAYAGTERRPLCEWPLRVARRR